MSTLQDSLHAQHISTNTYTSYESARTGFFALQIDGLNDILLADKNSIAKDATTGSKAEEAIILNVLTCDVPHFSVEPLQYQRGNEIVKFAGKPSWSAGTVTVDDVIGLHTKDILMAWQALTYDVHTGKGGRMKNYKKQATLIEYTQDYEQVRKWILIGVWPSEISEDGFDKENDGKRKITMKLEYDKAYVEEASYTSETGSIAKD